MPFEKGHKKSKGKPQGTPNKTTKEIKQAFQMLIENNLDNIAIWLNKVAEQDPGKALTHIEQLSEYVIPKLARTQTEHSGEIKQTIINCVTKSKTLPNELDKLNGAN